MNGYPIQVQNHYTNQNPRKSDMNFEFSKKVFVKQLFISATKLFLSVTTFVQFFMYCKAKEKKSKKNQNNFMKIRNTCLIFQDFDLW